MRAILIPLADFLDAAIRASDTAAARFAGIVVVLDRKSERRSKLLDDLSADADGINDVTRRDLLIAVPGGDDHLRAGIDSWIPDPAAEWQVVGAPGLQISGGDDASWASRLWGNVGDLVDALDDANNQRNIARAVTRSASAVCDYMGLSEADVPSVLLFDLHGRHVFIFRYGGDDDVPLYQFFKEIASRKPVRAQPGWLTATVFDLANDWRLTESPEVPRLIPKALADWNVTRYLPRPLSGLAWSDAHG